MMPALCPSRPGDKRVYRILDKVSHLYMDKCKEKTVGGDHYGTIRRMAEFHDIPAALVCLGEMVGCAERLKTKIRAGTLTMRELDNEGGDAILYGTLAVALAQKELDDGS